MKKHYAILIVFILALNPILASATVSDSDDNPQPAQVNNSENTPITQPNDVPPEPEPVIDNPIPAPENNNNDVPEIPKDNNVPDTPNPEVEPKVELPDEPGIEKDVKDDSKDKEDDVKDDDEDNKTEEDDESITEESEEDDNKVHVHVFKYTGNKDGTHTVTCSEMIEPDENSEDEAATECTYEEIEPCEYNENDICIYCGEKKPEEEKEFNPSISISITNDTCVIGEDNPLIKLDLSQDEYSIAYAQICLANYSGNSFINVGLAQGKYFDTKADEFVYTSNDSWYANPNITEELATGKYTIRSLYIRSTEGDFVHYSIESDTLPEEYSKIGLNIMDETEASKEPPAQDEPTESIEPYETPDHPETYEEPIIPEVSDATDEDKEQPTDASTGDKSNEPDITTEVPAEKPEEQPVVNEIPSEDKEVPSSEVIEVPEVTTPQNQEEDTNINHVEPEAPAQENNAAAEIKPSTDNAKSESPDNSTAKVAKETVEQVKKVITQIFKIIKRLFKFW